MVTRMNSAGWVRRLAGMAGAAALAVAASTALMLASPMPPAAASGSTAGITSSPDCQYTSGTLEAWLYVHGQGVEFEDSGGWGAYYLTFNVPSSIDKNWGGIDNPAPLLWYYQHTPGSNTQFYVMFGPCVPYSPQLIQAMKADHFAPSMVSGYNPPGLTAPAPTSPSITPVTSKNPTNPTNPTTPKTTTTPTTPKTTTTQTNHVTPAAPTTVTTNPATSSSTVPGPVVPKTEIIPPVGEPKTLVAMVGKARFCMLHPTAPKCLSLKLAASTPIKKPVTPTKRGWSPPTWSVLAVLAAIVIGLALWRRQWVRNHQVEIINRRSMRRQDRDQRRAAAAQRRQQRTGR